MKIPKVQELLRLHKPAQGQQENNSSSSAVQGSLSGSAESIEESNELVFKVLKDLNESTMSSKPSRVKVTELEDLAGL